MKGKHRGVSPSSFSAYTADSCTFEVRQMQIVWTHGMVSALHHPLCYCSVQSLFASRLLTQDMHMKLRQASYGETN